MYLYLFAAQNRSTSGVFPKKRLLSDKDARGYGQMKTAEIYIYVSRLYENDYISPYRVGSGADSV